MFRQIVLLTLIALAASAVPKQKARKHTLDGRIVGGHDADILTYPHQVSLQWDGRHVCGGSIISPNYIVTAAHCTDGSTAEEYSIRANTSLVQSGGIEIDIKTIYQNPKYDQWIADYDISVLELSKPLDFGPGISAIALPKAAKEIADGTKVSVTGWGILSEDDQYLSLQLQVVEVDIVNKKVCQSDYEEEEITARMICAGVGQGGKDACAGDSGGPLIADGTLWGIVSWGYGCAERHYPGVYGSVAGLRGYITEVTGL